MPPTGPETQHFSNEARYRMQEVHEHSRPSRQHWRKRSKITSTNIICGIYTGVREDTARVFSLASLEMPALHDRALKAAKSVKSVSTVVGKLTFWISHVGSKLADRIGTGPNLHKC